MMIIFLWLCFLSFVSLIDISYLMFKKFIRFKSPRFIILMSFSLFSAVIMLCLTIMSYKAI